MNFLWVIFTVVAAAGQTARDAMQRELTTSLGAVGATRVRFLFGFPFALAVGLVVQASVPTSYLAVANPGVLRSIVRLWRPSLFARFMGPASSEFWFLAFALATAASVRTLGLIDVLFAQMVSHILFRQKSTLREAAGIILLVAGAILLVYSHI